ncbi:unnamed protein product [Paramecium primaurelia]|uniref:RCK N-terminal domain-containing protein n=2 Tax=Paramecium TaxID=5884 RepID=A0A8S1UJF6_9CILI|nr:unnamed protein product [Paramecium primaurelia]CAD8165198.1 unnamed protein product [Paramecium pentaurelia]
MKLSQVAPMPIKQEVEDFENRVTLRLYLEKLLSQKWGRYLDIVSGFISLTSCMIYLGTTYFNNVDWLSTIDIIVCSLYLFEYLLKTFAAQHRLQYILEVNSAVELFTLMPLFILQEQDNWDYLTRLINISRVIRFLRVVKTISKYYQVGDNEFGGVNKQIYTISLTILTLIIVTAGVLQAFESPKRKELIALDQENQCGASIDECTFHEMVYFTVVTLATVGYGDVTPQTEEGRVCVIVLIIIVLVVIPKQMNELIRLMGLQSVYARAFYKWNPEVPHIIICGHVSVAALRNFCSELFHQDHGSQDKNAIIMRLTKPNTEMEIFLHNPKYELFLTYLQGSPMVDRDLKRAAATQAKACVILTNKQIVNSQSSDHKNILIGLQIKKYVNHITGGNIRLCMQLIKPESKLNYRQALGLKVITDQIISVEEFKMNLLAKSCFCPGIIALIGNLITSAGEQEGDMEYEWLNEYTKGMGHEIYRTDLSFKFQGKSFSEVATIVYNEFKGILFGIEFDIGKYTIIRLNPGSYIIPNTTEANVHAYIICEDKKVADQVATYEMTTEEIANYHYQLLQKSKQKEKLPDDEEEEKFDDPLLYGKDSIEEAEMLEQDYVLDPEPISLMTVTPTSLQDSTEITNHIVVCGIHPSIYYFLLALRAKYLKELQFVVILAPEQPTKQWEYINRFPKVRFIKGSPLTSDGLLRANINFADKAVIFAQGSDQSIDEVGDAIDEMHDAESIFIYKAIKKLNPSIQIMIELVYSSNIEFLLEKDYQYQNEFKYEFTPLQASGEVYISAIIDTLTCQAYFNPHIVTILQQILTGQRQSTQVIRAICEHADLKDSNLYQVPVPEDYLNKTFGELFNYLSTERHLIPLGLYRMAGAVDNKHPYVYTNPPSETKLTHRDKVFVLAHQLPADLTGGSNLDLKAMQMEGKQLDIENENKGLMQDKFKNQIQNGMQKTLIKQKNDKMVVFSGVSKSHKNLDLDNLNVNSTTFTMLDQINETITLIKEQIQSVQTNLLLQEDEIVEKCRTAVRYELTTLIQ